MTMRAVQLAAAAALLASSTPAAHASLPTSFIDIHLVTSFSAEGSVEKGFLFRVEASESNFGKSPPMGPKWATHESLTGGGGKEPDHLKHMESNLNSAHPSHRLVLPPDADVYLCNEAEGSADYSNPTGNAASGVFDPDTGLSGFEGNYVLVSRGKCTFEAKARSAQRLGASGVIVRNTLDSKYRLIDEDADTNTNLQGPDWGNTKWPEEQRDYECGTNKAHGHVGWRAEIETSALSFRPPPYDGTINDVLLTGPAVDGSLCAKEPNLENFEHHCPSQRCVLTGKNASSDGSTLEACCAWDMYVRMATDGELDGDAVPQEEEEDIVIPALFVTMESGDELYEVVVDAAIQQGEIVQFVNVVPYARWYPPVHFSGIVVWVVALLTLGVSAYGSATEYRTSWKKISQAVSDGVVVFQRSAGNSGRERVETEDTVDLDNENGGDFELEMANQGASATPAESNGENGSTPTSPGSDSFSIDDDADGTNEDDFVGNPTSPSPADTPASTEETAAGEEGAASSGPATEQQEPPATPNTQQPQRVNANSQSSTAGAQSMELNALHVVLFVACASGFLFILFFFNLDKVIRVLYGIGGSVAMNHILFYPLYDKLLVSKFRLGGAKIANKLQSNAFGKLPYISNLTWMEVLSAASAWSFGIAWIVIGMTRVHPMSNGYYWFIQDVMGVCFCILILGLIHINTIMVASILLCLVFVYDIFYVFISPYIVGSSMMIDVATGANGIDPTFCEKYPSDKACRGAFAPLPMLLAVPWFNDFRGGFSMLGLGDIILPGLLISFAARYDAARDLVKKCTQTSTIRSGENDLDIAPEDVESSSSRYHYHFGRVQKALFYGYFGPLMIAYGIGLMVAYIVVWSTKTGQPALLYLVPACLGTVLFLGWRRRELSELWSGPVAMKKANKMVNVAKKIPAARPASSNVAESATMV